MKFFTLAFLFVFILVSCVKDKVILIEELPTPSLPETYYNYDDFVKPSYMTGSVYDFFENTPQDNPVTNEGATLGRVLFYDKQLSRNNSISCASCHQQEFAFTDPEQFSTGLYGGATSRNSMALINSFMGFRFFWDVRVNSLEDQTLMPIEHPVEMDMNLQELEDKLALLEYYPELFEDAFGSPEITSERISKALAQFIRSIYSVNSKFDQGVQSNFSNFTAQELMGKDLFFVDSRTNCNGCHQTYYFFDSSPHNNGSSSTYDNDAGLGGITGNSNQIGLFKTPTLRNVEFTAPYFHDGRFANLEEVIEFYNSGIQGNPNLDDRLTTTNFVGGPPRQMNLTQQEKDALVAFLKTLSEPEIRTKERWSDPFN